MSHRWKIFVQGPSLHEGTGITSLSHSSSSKSTNEDGEKTAQYYSEIINLPSTAKPTTSHTNTKRKQLVASSSKPTPPKEPPPFSKLLKLAEQNNEDELESILSAHQNINLDKTDEFGWTLLMVAACAGSEDCVSLLLEKGANWKIQDKKGLNALSLAQKNHKKQVCELIQRWQELKTQLELNQQNNCAVNSHHVNSDVNSTTAPEFCDPCQTQVNDTAHHSKSIAHLFSTSKEQEEKIHYGIPESNVGFQLMVRTGWDRNTGLGPEGLGQKYPVKTTLKQNRSGLGKERKQARITHFAAFDTAAVERQIKPGERLERHNTMSKKAASKRKTKEQRKEINFRRDFESID